jgi:hypothetical protein
MASIWVGVAHEAMRRRTGTSQCSVCSALPTSEDKVTMMAIQRTGGSQCLRGTPQ